MASTGQASHALGWMRDIATKVVPFHRHSLKPDQLSKTLRSIVNAKFAAHLLSMSFQSLDPSGNGSVDFGEFKDYFSQYATAEEARIIFDLIDKEQQGQITQSAFASFQALHQPHPIGMSKGKMGSPDFLQYQGLLEGIHLSCLRETFDKKVVDAKEHFPPSEGWLLTEMAQEWNAQAIFSVQWTYVMSEVPYKEDERRYPNGNGGFSVRDTGHEGMSIDDFYHHPMAVRAGLTRSEVLGLRLSTGPGFLYLNRSLRANSDRFPVTQYCTDRAIGKMAQFGECRTLLHGMQKPMHPRWVRQYELSRGVGRKKLVISDPGFLSTTDDLQMANDARGAVFFQLQTSPPVNQDHGMGFLGNGADVQWVSQYPQQAEVFFPTNALLIPRSHLQCAPCHASELPQDSKIHQFFIFYPWNFQCNAPLVTQDYLDCANALLLHVHAKEVEDAAKCERASDQKNTFCSIDEHQNGAKTFEAFAMPSMQHAVRYPDADHFQPMKDMVPIVQPSNLAGSSIHTDVENKLPSFPATTRSLSHNADSLSLSLLNCCSPVHDVASQVSSPVLVSSPKLSSHQDSYIVTMETLGSSLSQPAGPQLYTAKHMLKAKLLHRPQYDDGLDGPGDPSQKLDGFPEAKVSTFLGSAWDPGVFSHTAAGFFLSIKAPNIAASAYATLLFVLFIMLACAGFCAILAAPRPTVGTHKVAARTALSSPMLPSTPTSPSGPHPNPETNPLAPSNLLLTTLNGHFDIKVAGPQTTDLQLSDTSDPLATPDQIASGNSGHSLDIAPGPALPASADDRTISCGQPSHLNTVYFPCSIKHGGSCTAYCDTGYTGSPSAECKADGTWFYSGSCEPVPCGRPSRLNTVYSPCSFRYGDSCTASCVAGFIGSPRAECKADGTWSYSGSCEPVSCGHPLRANTVHSPCSFTYGGSCTAFCIGGFAGSPSAECMADGNWSYSGSCEPVSCGLPSRPNTVYSPCSFRYGDSCTASCVAGFIGSPSAECTADRTWSYGGLCEPVSCGNPLRPNTVYLPCNLRYGESCTASCIPGFAGSPSAECTADGTWSYGGSCEPVSCGLPSRPNTVHSPCSIRYGDSCTASCVAGFTGSPSAECTADRTWSYGGSCEPVSCGIPSRPNTVHSPCNTRYGDSCTASCIAGFAGFPSAECMADRTWSYGGSCEPVSCGNPSRPNTLYLPCSNRYGGSCTASCIAGYTGSPSAECMADRNWSYGGSCEPVSCGIPSRPNTVHSPCSIKYGESCTASCIAGFVGSPSAECMADGTWSYGGSCEPVSCGHPSRPNILYSPCSIRYGDSCTAYCNNGYTGSPSAECMADGTWSYGGLCEPVSCGNPSQPNTLYLPCTIKYGGACKAYCNAGYTGSPSAECMADGTWSYGGSCEPVSCGIPSRPNIVYSPCNIEYGGSCTASCIAGYTGYPSAECMADGTWSYSGSCEPVNPSRVSNGTTSATVWLLETSPQYNQSVYPFPKKVELTFNCPVVLNPQLWDHSTQPEQFKGIYIQIGSTFIVFQRKQIIGAETTKLTLNTTEAGEKFATQAGPWVITVQAGSVLDVQTHRGTSSTAYIPFWLDCSAGGMITCPTGITNQCIDSQNDQANCGACGNACPSGRACLLGKCL